MNQSDCSGKTLKLRPVFVDHFNFNAQQGEVGLESGMNLDIANNQTLRPFVTRAYQKEFADNNSININEVNIDNNVAGSGVKISAGMEYKVQQNSGAYIVVSNVSPNGNTGSESPWSVGSGVVYSW
jgi:outer membrane autotransporter protein